MRLASPWFVDRHRPPVSRVPARLIGRGQSMGLIRWRQGTDLMRPVPSPITSIRACFQSRVLTMLSWHTPSPLRLARLQ